MVRKTFFKFLTCLVLITSSVMGLSISAHAADMAGLSLGPDLVETVMRDDGGSMNFSSFALDGTTDSVEFIYQMDEAATITKVCFFYGFKSGGAPPTYIASVQGVATATGRASGTILGGGSPASATFTPPNNGSWDTTPQCITLTNSIAVTRGQLVAGVIAYSSGTIGGNNNFEIAYGLVGNGSGSKNGFPYVITVAAGSPTKQNARIPLFWFESASKTYGYPGTELELTQYSSDTTPDERGLKFTLPADACATFKVRGFYFLGSMSATGKTVEVTLYDGTTSLQDVILYSDVVSYSVDSGNRPWHRYFFDEADLSELDCGTAYRIAFAPQETSSNFALATRVVASGDLTAFGGGVNYQSTTRTDAGSWTDDDTKLPQIRLIIDDITAPVGGSSGPVQVYHRGLQY